MEVAGLWRHQWAGAAEYGKMVDGVGGVTRMARALEVRTTSGPGARTRVTRAAFHSKGPLSSSYVFHSSKRTILSSRVESDDLVSPTLVWRPQEVSSTPLDVASDSCPEGDEPYKVTEPDDNDISEPSKWRSSQAISEESSSIETASLVDSSVRDAVAGRRTDSSKTSSASSQSNREDEPKTFRSSFRRKPTTEPLMKISEHAKCLESSKLLTNKPKDEWHDRRNSYGFETSTLNGIKSLSEDDKIGMESSTDSGICKSSEVVNIPIKHYSSYDSDHSNKESKVEYPSESFQDWLAKNRSMTTPKPDYPSIGKNIRDDGLINLKSLGKITISLPKYESSDDEKYKQGVNISYLEEPERKQKKVGFCKTELHFAAESGIVNIIETDDKPPPKHDFRKRRSAFVPIKNHKDKPITLFGGIYSNENGNIDSEETLFEEIENSNDRLNNEHDDDSNVKSILKNKIPKPKPYLLGEDMNFDKGLDSMENIWGVRLRRTSDEYLNGNFTKSPISILNESLKQDNPIKTRHIQDIDHYLETDSYVDKNAEREYQSSPAEYVNVNDYPRKTQSERSVASTQTPDDFISLHSKKKTYNYENKETSTEDMSCEPIAPNFVHEKLKLLQLSPIMKNRAKTRQLRQNELTYFGVKTDSSTKDTIINVTMEDEEKNIKSPTRRSKNYEQPIYQNIPLRPLPVPVPAPRSTKELQKKVFNNKQPSLEKSNSNNKSDEDKPSKIDDSRMRILEPIKEIKSSKDHKKKSAYKENKDSRIESKQKSTTSSSPNFIRVVETPPRSSIWKTNSRESVIRSRESSVEDLGHTAIKKHHYNEKEKPQKPNRDSVRKSDTTSTNKTKYIDIMQNNSSCHRTPLKEIDSVRKNKARSSSVDSTKKSLHRHSVERRNQSVDRRSYKDNEYHKHTTMKEKCPKIIKEAHHIKSSKNRVNDTSNGGSFKNKALKHEYIINCDDKNGTSSTGHPNSRHNSIKKQDKETKAQSKPKEVTRTSRVATLQMKTPMLIKESQHRTKIADPTRSRKKYREESLQ